MADEKVVSIRGGRVAPFGEPNEVLIKVLEGTLAKARAGQLQSFIGVGFTADGGRLSVWGPEHANIYEMRGSLAWLAREYEDRVLGESDGGITEPA